MNLSSADYFKRAIIAKLLYEAFTKEGDLVLANAYRNESVYFIAKALEALTVESSKHSPDS